MPALLLGQDVEAAPGLGLRGQDAFDGTQRVGPEADGPLQGGQQIGAGVAALQRQQFEGLLLAVALAAQQAVEEALGQRPQLREAFPQQRLVPAGIGAGLAP